MQLPEVERIVRWAELRRMAESAERIGLDSVWVGDHLLYRGDGLPERGPWEAWSTLAAVAAVTERVEIGPLVAATSFHNPAMLAKKAAAVDEISGGRLLLGLGAGWNEAEYRAFGFPYDHRVSRFEEAFAIIRTLLAGQRCDFEGAYYRVEDCVLQPPPRPGGPPLMIGSMGPRMLSIALPHVASWNAWFTWFDNKLAGYRELRARIDTACVDAGRDPADVERTIALFVAFEGAQGRQLGDRSEPDVDPIDGRDVSRVAAELRAYAEEGVGHVQLVLDPITMATVEALAPVLAALDA